jgi:type II secretory pathway predicted ATPase ExeA
MYLEYGLGLKRFPFENVPDLEFMYYSQEHEKALVRLLYAAKRRKVAALLTGEGSGRGQVEGRLCNYAFRVSYSDNRCSDT